MLLEREKEVSELRAHRMREGVEGGRGEGVEGGRVADMERQLEVVNETVEQLKVCVCVHLHVHVYMYLYVHCTCTCTRHAYPVHVCYK